MTPRLAHVRRGERAFERLYRRHVADVYRYTLVLLRDPEDAELVTQTTFLNAYGAHRRGERPGNARPWLLALAHDLCRRRVGAPAADADADADPAVRAVPDPVAPTPHDIRRALARLPFEQRAALVMRELEGRPYAEISAVLELPASAVERLVFEARQALREQLEGALSCHEAERSISLRMDGRLRRTERRALRRHLRECEDCAGFERSQRAQRTAWKSLGRIPLPASLHSFFGPDGVLSSRGGLAGVAAAGVTAKLLATVAAAGAAALAVGHETQRQPAEAPPVSAVPAEASRALPLERSTAPPRARRLEQSPRPRAIEPSATPTPAARTPTRPASRTVVVQAVSRSESGRLSRAFPIRLRAKPRGSAQAAATRPSAPVVPPAETRAVPQPPVVAAPPTLPPVAPPTLPPVALPQFPPVPPLPLPPPTLP
jgi:DNA-directed RNA polymerase specialized sigma24 family protein